MVTRLRLFSFTNTFCLLFHSFHSRQLTMSVPSTLRQKRDDFKNHKIVALPQPTVNFSQESHATDISRRINLSRKLVPATTERYIELVNCRPLCTTSQFRYYDGQYFEKYVAASWLHNRRARSVRRMALKKEILGIPWVESSMSI